MIVIKHRILTREQVRVYLSQYTSIIKEIEQYRCEMGKLLPAASTAQYGIEATLPKAQGGVSNPTFNQAINGPANDAYITRRLAVVSATKQFKRHIKEPVAVSVLDCWMRGCTVVETSTQLNISKRKVDRLRSEILDLIIEGEKG